MHPRTYAFTRLRFVVSVSAKNSVFVDGLLCFTTKYTTLCEAQVENAVEKGPRNPIEVLKRWGCSDEVVSQLVSRQPNLYNANANVLRSKLEVLKALGLESSDLVKVVNRRPRFLSVNIRHCFDQRIEYYITLFGSRELLCKAIVRNPSLLTYDFHNRVKPIIALYEEMGLTRSDLTTMLLSRPTLIPRTTFTSEKMEYIRKTGTSKDSKMYKYVVCLVGISRPETIREKVANLEKCGISEDEVWKLFGKSPLVLTLSVDKVQRNMTFIMGVMKLHPRVITEYPFLLFVSLERILRPRGLLATKIKEMRLSPQIGGPLLFRALRMTEKRFLKIFILHHEIDLAEELMKFYEDAKCVKRLAESSKKYVRKGFPF